MSRYTDTLGKILDGAYDHASTEERDGAVRDLVEVCSIAAAAAAFQPIPLVDLVLITPIQIGLVQGIGRIYGHRLDKKAVLEIIGTLGASIAAQGLIMSAAKLVPVAGWVASAAMAYALTWATGEVADHYFKTGRGVPQSELREMFKKTYQSKRAEKVQAHAQNNTLKQRLGQLQDALDAGLITEDEYNAKKQDILSSF